MNPLQQIRAVYDEHTLVVYQAYRREIAEAAVKHQTFVAPFKMDRMTWIKPSFLWMMYRAGWGRKEGQEHILRIRIKREGLQWALDNACLSHYDSTLYSSHEQWQEKLRQSPVRIQWDPEKDIYMQNLPYRSLQVGLSGVAVQKYVHEWITAIEDITPYCHELQALVQAGKVNEAKERLPLESVL